MSIPGFLGMINLKNNQIKNLNAIQSAEIEDGHHNLKNAHRSIIFISTPRLLC